MTERNCRLPVLAARAGPRQLRRKGILLALAATASVSLNFVTAKYAMTALEPPTFVPLWFAAASFYCGVYGLWQRRQWAVQLRRSWPSLLVIGLLCALASILIFTGLHLLDPTVASFLARSDAVCMILLGLIVLGERLTRQTGAGMALALVGMGVVSYAAGRAHLGAALLVIVGFFFTSLSRLFVKQIAATTSALLINWARVTVAAVVMAAIALGTGHFHITASPRHLTVLILGAFFGPFLAQALYFHALRYIGLSELGVMRATQPLFVALYASVFLGMVPTPRQFLGGLLVIIGAILMARGQSVEQARGQPEADLLAN